jgi:hypothetical protein
LTEQQQKWIKLANSSTRLHKIPGMRTQPGSLSFPYGVDAIGVIIRPEAAYRLLGPPHSSITNRTFDGEEIFGAAARRLQDELIDLPSEEIVSRASK